MALYEPDNENALNAGKPYVGLGGTRYETAKQANDAAQEYRDGVSESADNIVEMVGVVGAILLFASALLGLGGIFMVIDGQGIGWLYLLGSVAGAALAILSGVYRKVLDPILYVVLGAGLLYFIYITYEKFS